MAEQIAAATLKTGETLEVMRVPAPGGEWADRIVNFMYIRHIQYANCNWHHNAVRVAAGEFLDTCDDVFFAGVLDGEIVGACWYGAPADTLDLATFGRVVTLPTQRRKGISRILCAAAVEDFRARGGWAMHLGTDRTNPARFIYEGLGFRHYNFVEDHGTIMRLVLRGEYDTFEEEYFAAGQPVSLRPLHWGDLARAETLYNLPHWFLKDTTCGIFANTPFEGQFYDLMAQVGDCGEPGTVLETSERRMVGMAYTARTTAGAEAQEHVRVLEFLVHPNYMGDGPQLIGALAAQSPAQKLLAYSSALDVSRCEALEEAGFVREATLEDCLQDAESVFDMYVYSLSR
ncbi:MAG: GNAT family N-acetyltransferase [Bacteroidota bacterium]